MGNVKYIVNCDNKEVQKAWNLYKEFYEIFNLKLDYSEPKCHFWLCKADTSVYEEDVPKYLLEAVKSVLEGLSNFNIKDGVNIYAFDYDGEVKGLACWAVQFNLNEKAMLSQLVYHIRESYVEEMKVGFDVLIKKGGKS